MRLQKIGDLLESSEREGRDASHSREAGLAGPEPAHDAQQELERFEVGVIGARLEADVVAEPPGLLVRVRMAVDVLEQAYVIRRDSFVAIEADDVRQAQRDRCLANRMLHRLPTPEIGGQRQGGDQLREPDAAVRTASGGHCDSLRMCRERYQLRSAIRFSYARLRRRAAAA